MWKKPLALGMKYGVPVIINGVGMPYEFGAAEITEARELLQVVQYVSLRDPFSYNRWQMCFGDGCKAYLIPDTIWSIRSMFDRTHLAETLCSLRKKYGITKDYFLLQYGTTYAYRQVYRLAEKFAHSHDGQLVTFAINACHEDRFVVEHLITSEEKAENSVIIGEELQPVESAALLAGTQMFVGTSLHGNLSASAYGKKNVIIDMYPDVVGKLDGFSAMAKVHCNVVGDILDLWNVMETVYEKDNFNTDAAKQREDSLGEHFKRICHVIEKRTSYR